MRSAEPAPAEERVGAPGERGGRGGPGGPGPGPGPVWACFPTGSRLLLVLVGITPGLGVAVGPDASLVRGPVWAGPGAVAGCLQAAGPFSYPGGGVQPVIPSSPHGVGLSCRERGGGLGSAAALRPASLLPAWGYRWGLGAGARGYRRGEVLSSSLPAPGAGRWSVGSLAFLVTGAGSPAQADTAASACV